MDKFAVEPAFHRRPVDLHLYMVVAAGFNLARSQVEIGFSAVLAILEAVLRIVPSAYVPPAVVGGVGIVEHDEEALASGNLARVAFENVGIGQFSVQYRHIALQREVFLIERLIVVAPG